MSLNVSWLAVEGVDRADLLARLGLEEVGEANSEFDSGDAWAVSATGWLLLKMGGSQKAFDRALKLASPGQPVLACVMSEIAMGSDVRMLRDGAVLWSATCDLDKDPDHLIVVGQPPGELADICVTLKAAADKDTDDLFEAPVELAAKICGYQPGRDGLDWTLVAKTAVAKTGAGRGSPTRPRSLKGAIDAELVPLIASLGWRPAEHKDWYQRRVGAMRHDVWFDYGGGKKPYISCSYCASEPSAEGFSVKGFCVPKVPQGSLGDRLLKRLLGRRLSPADRIDQVVKTACEEIRDIDGYLRTGVRPYNLRLY